MNEAEFNILLDAVSDAFHERPFDSLWSPPLSPDAPANDNEMAWPVIPFPDGWHASC